MKPGVHQALKVFEERLHEAFPQATFEMTEQFCRNGVLVEFFLK